MDKRKRLKEIQARIRALLAQDAMSDEEREELANITAEGEQITQELASAEFADGLSFEDDEDGDDDGDGDQVEEQEPEPEPQAAKAKRGGRRKGGSYRDVNNAAGAPAVIRNRGTYKIDQDAPIVSTIQGLRMGVWPKAILPLGKHSAASLKALSEGTASAGGYLVPVEQSNNLIEILSARAAVRRAGATVIPMKSDTLEVPSQTGGATAYWVAENAQITASDQTWGQVSLSPNKLAALTKLSSELFEDSDPQVEALVVRDLARVLALEEDIKYLRGDGTGNTPTGLLNQASVTETELGAGNGATPDFDDLADAIYRLDADNVPDDGRAWIMHPRTANTLRKIKDSQNRYIWSDPAAPGDPPTIWGYPVFFTTAIPINLTVGTSNDCTEIYVGSWPEALIGQRKSLELRASDSAGNAFEYDQVFIRAIMRVDFGVRHPESFEIVDGVRP